MYGLIFRRGVDGLKLLVCAASVAVAVGVGVHRVCSCAWWSASECSHARANVDDDASNRHVVIRIKLN